MKSNTVHQSLHELLEKEIPSSEVDLWPSVRASILAAGDQKSNRGNGMRTRTQRRLPRVAFAASVFVIVVIVAMVTPQGRAFSQSILRFFTQSEGTTFPLAPEQIITQGPDATDPTAEPPSALLSVTEAEKIVGFDVVELPMVPDGLTPIGTRLYGQAVTVEYETEDKGGHLIIRQSQEGYEQTDWDAVPAEAIVPVKIGSLDGEFVQGTFVVRPGQDNAEWFESAPLLRLRWTSGAVWFELIKFGDVEPIEYLDQDVMIEMAESLVSASSN